MGLIDYTDLDSHYNLNPDPVEGSFLAEGITMLRETIVIKFKKSFMLKENQKVAIYLEGIYIVNMERWELELFDIFQIRLLQ